MAAIIFKDEIIDATRGKTAINFLERHNSAGVLNNLVNSKMFEGAKKPPLGQKQSFARLKQKMDREFVPYVSDQSVQDLMSGINEAVNRQKPRPKSRATNSVRSASDLFEARQESVYGLDPNPFKACVTRLLGYMSREGMDPMALLKTFGGGSVPVNKFARFLQQKVTKEYPLRQVQEFAKMIDVDKDGRICPHDLRTCLDNLNSHQFYRHGGRNLQSAQFGSKKKFYVLPDRLREIDINTVNEVRRELQKKLKDWKSDYKMLFSMFDPDGDEMINYAQFEKALTYVLPLDQPVVEKIFAQIDKNKVGMVSFEQFKGYLEVDEPDFDPIFLQEKHQQKVVATAEDSFEW
mmetsp:Transcript_13876/g.21632  ORF Transcript_13876/g.21632 Transcript_13876/m.21632 type:complete len:349 (-) Transcript_13876:2074-3120(-)